MSLYYAKLSSPTECGATAQPRWVLAGVAPRGSSEGRQHQEGMPLAVADDYVTGHPRGTPEARMAARLQGVGPPRA
jgi:hypothetical protein